MAGAPDAAPTVNVYLNQWLRSRAQDQMWPELIKRGKTISVPQGQQDVVVGATPGGSANSGISDQIFRIVDPIWIYSSDYSSRGEARIRHLFGGTIDDDETINDPTTNKGIPTLVKARIAGYAPGTKPQLGAWALVFTPYPDKAYLAVIDYSIIPADLDTTVGGADASTAPWYPNDLTMLSYIEHLGHRFKQRSQLAAMKLQETNESILNDRMKLGTVPGTDDVNEVDEGMFRGGRPTNYSRWP